MIYDYCVIGGMVGLATAMKLLEMRPKASMLLKREGHVTAHRTGHNSGVIHPSIYYAGQPQGEALRCRGEGHQVVLQGAGNPSQDVEQADVATSDGEMERIGEVPERAVGNGIRLERKSEFREIEPHVTGRGTSWVPGRRSSTTRK